MLAPGIEVVGVNRFGASAPADAILKEYGFTAENVCGRADVTSPEAQGTEEMKDTPLAGLERLGQSVWIDFIRREMITSGELPRLIEENGVSGLTSNPSIFEQAIAGSRDYDADIRRLTLQGESPEEIYDALTVRDVQIVADLLYGTYDRLKGEDGFVSLEVSPLDVTVATAVKETSAPLGGVGRVSGLLRSALAVLQVVSTGFNLLGFSSYLGTALWGVILIVVMLANRLLSSRTREGLGSTHNCKKGS